jgi:DNA helicase HerA-like ATPase
MDHGAGILIGRGDGPQVLRLEVANRHGLIAGATGTGKTVSLQVLAEGFSRQGVPVFMADVKGDLSGISQPGTASPKLLERAREVGLNAFEPAARPVLLFDLFGESGHPIRTTISEMGPLLLARLLALNETQQGVLSVAFALADDRGWLLLDLKDLRALMHFMGDNAQELSLRYGRVGAASIGAIQRRLLTLEQQGGEHFFGEPAFAIADLMRTDGAGQGQISILAADRLMLTPKLYVTFLLWLLSELFEELPEVGDLDRPKLVFFFDEAHLLFDEAPKVLLERVEQVVRLIRSKGVGVYFITQNPMDLPDDVLGQLGNRIQHALRAFTPRDQKAVSAAAETLRTNPKLDVTRVITELRVGEALVSTLDAGGAPGIVERTLVRPPCSRIGPATSGERAQVLETSPLAGRYDQPVDRQSAYEVLNRRTAERADGATAESGGIELPPGRAPARAPARRSTRSRRDSSLEAMAKSFARSVGTQIGRQIVRGVLGSLLRR